LTRAAALVRVAVEETLTYYAFPEEHWRRIRTNNPLERILWEIRRRTRVVGRSTGLAQRGGGLFGLYRPRTGGHARAGRDRAHSGSRLRRKERQDGRARSDQNIAGRQCVHGPGSRDGQHRPDAPGTGRSEVRFRGQTGKHLLILSLTGFDPKRT
jgi:hypothetical protein